jgi:hypothetical protein
MSDKNAKERELERKYKELALHLSSKGLTVRREKLKSGVGWKAVSGSCRVKDSKVILIDNKLPLLEQIEFLHSFLQTQQR